MKAQISAKTINNWLTKYLNTMKGEEIFLPNYYELQQQLSFSSSQVIQEMGFVHFENQNHQLFTFLCPPSQSTQISCHLPDQHTTNPSTINTTTASTTFNNDSLGFNCGKALDNKSSWSKNQIAQNLDPKAFNDEDGHVDNGNEDSNTWWKTGYSERSKMKTRRKLREPRFCFQTRSDVDVLDDGYKWRKYGQKVVKNSLHPRSYYRCTHSNCRVKKRVERLSEDCRMVITTYEGRHNHSTCDDSNSHEHDCFTSF